MKTQYVLPALTLAVASIASAQSVWITRFNDDPSQLPMGYRHDAGITQDIGINVHFDTGYHTVDLQASFNGGPYSAFSQYWDDGSGVGSMAATLPYACGKVTVKIKWSGTRSSYPWTPFTAYSNPVEVYVYNSPTCLPQCDPCQLTTSGQATGQPVTVATGKLWYETTDLALAGPFGARFARWYDSQSPGSGDLGYGWRHTYAANLVIVGSGVVRFFDAQGQRTDFTGVTDGASGHDIWTGSDLSLNGAVYTLTTWDRRKYTFDNLGRLTSLSDRVGNTQAMTRDVNNRVQTVTDPLGRTLTFTYDASNRVETVAATPGGAQLTFAYTGTNCPAGNLCAVTMPDAETWTYEYDGGNKLLKVADPLGHAEEINTYDGNGRLATQRTQPVAGVDQNVLTFTYNTASTTVTDGLNRSTTYTYDPKLLVVTHIAGPGCGCGGGQVREFTYDQFLRRTAEWIGGDPGRKTTWVYARDSVIYRPGFNELVAAYPGATSRTEPLSAGIARHTFWLYFPLGGSYSDLVQHETIYSLESPSENRGTIFTYDASNRGLLIQRDEEGYVDDTYDTNNRGRVTQVDGPRTDVQDLTSYSYYPDDDADLARRGQLQTITDALGHLTTYANGPSPFDTYDLFGSPRSITDPNAVVTTMSYDPRGRLTARTVKGVTGDPVDLTTAYQYDPAGKLTRVTMPLANGTSYTFDPSNRLTDTTRFDASGLEHERLHLTYDVMSQKTREDSQACTVPAAPCTAWTTTRYDTFGYDGFGRLASITHPDSTAIAYAYDAFGDLVSVQDERHTSPNTLYTYDFAHRLVQVQQTLGAGSANTFYTYTIHGDLASVVDPNANLTTYSWDAWGRMTSQTSPVTGTTTYAYDGAGNLLTSTDANAAATTRTYGALNRLLTAHSTRGGFTSEDVTYTYDDATAGHFGLGRLSGFTDPAGSTSFAYERRGLLASRVQTISGTAYPLSFLYDGNGNRTSMSYPSTRVVTTAFDFADRPTSAVSGGTIYVQGALYAPFGPLTSLAYGTTPPMQRTMTYDSRYLPESLTVAGASEVISYTYGTDSGGNLTAITDQGNAGYSRSFAYDDLGRLTMANTGGSLWVAGNHAYDPMGNLTSMQLGTTLRSFTYRGQTPKLSLVTETGSSRSVSYDLTGNESVQGASYLYSPRNLLAQVSGVMGAIVRAPLGRRPIRAASPDPLSVYTYDGRGIRVKLAQSDGGSSQERSFIYDDQMHLIAETTYQAPPSTAIQYEYVWFNGQPVAQETILGSTAWTVTDHLGTPFAQTNSSRTVIWRVEYEPYGSVYALRSGTDRHQPLRLPGQEAEQLDVGINGDSERSYNIFRWYRPKWGRYTQADPIGLAAGSNLYAYAGGGPARFVDPLGLELLECSRPVRPRWLGSTDPNSFRRHDFFYSTKSQKGCGLAAESGVGGGLTAFFPWSVSGRIEFESPFDENGSMKSGYHCAAVSRNPCIEDCAMKQCDKNPPRYSLCKGPACFDFVQDVLGRCQCGCK